MVTLLPTLTVPYLIGGLDGWTVLAATAVLVAYVAELTAISAAVSSAAKGPVSAIVVSIVVIVGMTILPELFLLLIGRPGSFPNSVIGTIAPQSVALWLPGLLLDEIWAEPGASLVFSTMWWFIVVLGALAFAVRRLKTPR